MKKQFLYLPLLLLLAILLIGCSTKTASDANINTDQPANPPVVNQPIDEFCGRSTNAPCEADVDCIVGGCSNQICQGKNEEFFTTCEYSDCYNAEKYGRNCGCFDRACQWIK
ncbi:MAG: eight-cysteine-cluster domain-containing protein [bacterium]